MTAAKNAAMRLIGLSTTLPEATVRNYTQEVIAGFSDTDAVMKLMTNITMNYEL
ncbi:MAG: hypothetical protein LBS12_00345 [Prevotellaceae bacterium]|jgi:hypothetical protein|nr:hypothetical protein [Prevotellaceae bacterium]